MLPRASPLSTAPIRASPGADLEQISYRNRLEPNHLLDMAPSREQRPDAPPDPTPRLRDINRAQRLDPPVWEDVILSFDSKVLALPCQEKLLHERH